jgi:K+/H+ antiporter YhaU regulatory subunit KhtT
MSRFSKMTRSFVGIEVFQIEQVVISPHYHNTLGVSNIRTDGGKGRGRTAGAGCCIM